MRRLFIVLLMIPVLAACGGPESASSSDISAEEVMQALQDSGLPIVDYMAFNEATDPWELLGRPGEYIGKVNFQDERLEGTFDEWSDTTLGGSIEVFESVDEREARQEYLQSAMESNLGKLAGKEYLYSRGAVLLRLTYSLTPDQAKEYEQSLNGL